MAKARKRPPRSGHAAQREPAGRHRKAVLARGHARQPLPHPDRVGKIRPFQSLEPWLGIEKIHLRWSTRLKQVNHSPGASGEIRKTPSPGPGRRTAGIPLGRLQLATEQSRQCDRPQPGAGPAEEGSGA